MIRPHNPSKKCPWHIKWFRLRFNKTTPGADTVCGALFLFNRLSNLKMVLNLLLPLRIFRECPNCKPALYPPLKATFAFSFWIKMSEWTVLKVCNFKFNYIRISIMYVLPGFSDSVCDWSDSNPANTGRTPGTLTWTRRTSGTLTATHGFQMTRLVSQAV